MSVQKPLRARIFEYIEKYGPVDMRDVLVGGVQTGYLSTEDNRKTVISSIHRMLDSQEISYTSQHRLVVNKK